MDLTKLVSIYGKPIFSACPKCNGKGCDNCNAFGYLGSSQNGETKYVFKYPLYIELKKRERVDLIKNISFASLTILLILSIIISYIINIVHNG